MDEREQRFAENEMMLRSVNEDIERIGEALFAGEANEPKVWDFLCECHRVECRERIGMTREEYEAVRASGRRFVVAPSADHVNMDIENVVDMSTRYWVVEKTDEAGELAEAGDPRE